MTSPIDTDKQVGLDAPVERLNLVDELERLQTGHFQSQSLQGHLLHIVTAGAVTQWAEGRAEVFGEGSVVWYHDNEPVHGEILRAPWRFITINFLAPSLRPPLDDQRVLNASAVTLKLGQRLLALWNDQRLPPLERQFRCHRTLLELLQHLLRQVGSQPSAPTAGHRWWRIEKHLRTRLEETHTLADICRMCGLSVRTVIRACKEATGRPPMHRLKELRLSFARGLVQHSDLTLTEIAFRVGYPRPQEFSRDYHRRFCLTPREDRHHPLTYRSVETPQN
ncbi:MAG: AraC family transcriptional regulator [bacterium]